MGRGTAVTHPYPSLPHPDPILQVVFAPLLSTNLDLHLGGAWWPALIYPLLDTGDAKGDANGPMLLPFLDEHGEIQQFSIVSNYFSC